MSNPQETWEEYYDRLKNRRADEAEQVWALMSADGVTEETIVALDFLHFSQDKEKLSELAEQLSENHETEITDADDKGYFNLECTTRPYGLEFSKEDLLAWIEFMCDVSQSYGCVFSTWTIESTELEKSWSNKNVESSKFS